MKLNKCHDIRISLVLICKCFAIFNILACHEAYIENKVSKIPKSYKLVNDKSCWQLALCLHMTIYVISVPSISLIRHFLFRSDSLLFDWSSVVEFATNQDWGLARYVTSGFLVGRIWLVGNYHQSEDVLMGVLISDWWTRFWLVYC